MLEISETNEYDAEGQDREDYTGKANVLLQLGNFSSAKTVAARAARMFISKVEIIDWSEHSMVEEASQILEVLIKTNLFEEADVIASSAIAHEEMWSTRVDFRTVLGIDIALALSVNAKGDEDLAVQFFPSADMNQLLQQVADNGDATKYIQHQFARFLPFPRMLARLRHSKLQAPLSVNTCLDGHENNSGGWASRADLNSCSFKEHILARVGSAMHIETVDADVMTREEFKEKYVKQGKPVVVQGATKNWKANLNWRKETFLRHYGEHLISVTESGSIVSFQKFDRSLSTSKMTLQSFADLIYGLNASVSGKTPYSFARLRSAGIAQQIISDDIEFPDFMNIPGKYSWSLKQKSSEHIFYIGPPGSHNEATQGAEQVPLVNLSIQDLNAIRQQTEQQLQSLMQNFTTLRMVQAQFGAAKRAVDGLKKNPVETEMLIPLTEGMFVPAKVKANDKLLVEIGTGYFVENNSKGTTEFLERKIAFLNKRLGELETVIRQQRQNAEQVKQVLQMKVQEQIKEQGQASS
eukprot:g989.t1